VKASLALEHIGANGDAALRQFGILGGAGRSGPWVDQLTAAGRVVVPCRNDYSKANSRGSRGVYRCFILESGRLYEVHERLSWRSSRNYFCAVTERGDIYELNQQEVAEWLSALSA
jgi:hypothetical protein